MPLAAHDTRPNGPRSFSVHSRVSRRHARSTTGDCDGGGPTLAAGGTDPLRRRPTDSPRTPRFGEDCLRLLSRGQGGIESIPGLIFLERQLTKTFWPIPRMAERYRAWKVQHCAERDPLE